MLSIHHFLSASAILFLVSCALARSLKDETLAKDEADVLAAETGGNERYLDPKTMTDLWDFLLTNGHATPYDQSGLSVLGVKRSWPNGFAVPTSMKRKMFWTPLGHLPAAARLGGSQNLRTSVEDSGSPVFRYG